MSWAPMAVKPRLVARRSPSSSRPRNVVGSAVPGITQKNASTTGKRTAGVRSRATTNGAATPTATAAAAPNRDSGRGRKPTGRRGSQGL
jgi:hypothetical protein